MKKNSKTALMAAVLTGAVMLTGCDHGKDDVQDVYGPPNVTEATEVTTEPVQCEYGAPVVSSVTATDAEPGATAVTEAPTTTGYDPSGGIQVVYGPPEMFEN